MRAHSRPILAYLDRGFQGQPGGGRGGHKQWCAITKLNYNRQTARETLRAAKGFVAIQYTARIELVARPFAKEPPSPGGAALSGPGDDNGISDNGWFSRGF